MATPQMPIPYPPRQPWGSLTPSQPWMTHYPIP